MIMRWLCRQLAITAEPRASSPCQSVSLVTSAYSDTYSLYIYAYYIVIMFQTNGFYYALLIAISLPDLS